MTFPLSFTPSFPISCIPEKDLFLDFMFSSPHSLSPHIWLLSLLSTPIALSAPKMSNNNFQQINSHMLGNIAELTVLLMKTMLPWSGVGSLMLTLNLWLACFSSFYCRMICIFVLRDKIDKSFFPTSPGHQIITSELDNKVFSTTITIKQCKGE